MYLQVTLEGKIEENFEAMFIDSGFRSRAEYVRFLIMQEHRKGEDNE